METNSSASYPQFYVIYIENFHMCLKTQPGTVCITTYTTINTIVQLPLCLFLICLGFQRQRSGTSMSHSDFFAYHLVATELIGILGTLAMFCGTYSGLRIMTLLGSVINFFYNSGQIIINILTCGEYYLAAIHPITYLSLRNAKWIRIRKIASCCVWLLTFGWTGSMMTQNNISTIVLPCVVACAIILVSFFCVSVLYVLIWSGPEKRGGFSMRVDQTKLKAFYVMIAIMGVLLLKFGGILGTCAIFSMSELGPMTRCIGYFSLSWTCLPSGVLHPLLFLKRAGKYACIKKHNETCQQ